MPRVTLTAAQRQNREFLAALRAGQVRRGEKDIDTAQLLPGRKERTYYRRVKSPELFTIADLRMLAQRYNFTDYQLCQIIGVEYHGSTPV